SVVVPTIREPDIAGWHTDKRVLGIVFSELGTHDKQSAFTALGARITTALTAALDRDELPSRHVALPYFRGAWEPQKRLPRPEAGRRRRGERGGLDPSRSAPCRDCRGSQAVVTGTGA